MNVLRRLRLRFALRQSIDFRLKARGNCFCTGNQGHDFLHADDRMVFIGAKSTRLRVLHELHLISFPRRPPKMLDRQAEALFAGKMLARSRSEQMRNLLGVRALSSLPNGKTRIVFLAPARLADERPNLGAAIGEVRFQPFVEETGKRRRQAGRALNRPSARLRWLPRRAALGFRYRSVQESQARPSPPRGCRQPPAFQWHAAVAAAATRAVPFCRRARVIMS